MILKKFPGYASQPFKGNITDFGEVSRKFSVLYEDGDEEEMTLQRIRRYASKLDERGHRLAARKHYGEAPTAARTGKGLRCRQSSGHAGMPEPDGTPAEEIPP